MDVDIFLPMLLNMRMTFIYIKYKKVKSPFNHGPSIHPPSYSTICTINASRGLKWLISGSKIVNLRYPSTCTTKIKSVGPNRRVLRHFLRGIMTLNSIFSITVYPLNISVSSNQYVQVSRANPPEVGVHIFTKL